MDLSDQILEDLYSKKNVILMGPPAVGKTSLMNKIAKRFVIKEGECESVYHDTSDDHVPLKRAIIPGKEVQISENPNRKVFRTIFHQNYKNKDFISGIAPSFSTSGLFNVTAGILYEANEFAKKEGCEALLIIDEINRGPAIEIFGGSIVSIEPDKRLSEDGKVLDTTQTFNMLSPEGENKGKMVEYALSPRLYILASMNQADSSIAALDVAFLRRWYAVHIGPDYVNLYRSYDIDPNTVLTDSPSNVKDVYHIAFQALERINHLITLSIGAEYQLGPGIFYNFFKNASDITDALKELAEVWHVIYSHLEELYFKQPLDLAFVLNAASDKTPYNLKSEEFGNKTIVYIECNKLSARNIYGVYYAIIGF